MVSVKVCRVNLEKAQIHHLSASKFAAARIVYLIKFRSLVKFIRGKCEWCFPTTLKKLMAIKSNTY